MSEKIEIIDKTVEGAIERGLVELGVKKANAEIEVVTEPGSGFLGLGSKQAKVQISVKADPKDYVETLLRYILDKIGVDGKINVEEDDEGNLYIDVSGRNMGVIIGRRGQTLNSLQYLTNVIMHRQFENFSGRIILDAENYRHERERSLKQLAQNIAYKAKKQNQEITLEPMTPQERRIIHLTLKDNPNISTYSSGEEPYRKVVISPE